MADNNHVYIVGVKTGMGQRGTRVQLYELPFYSNYIEIGDIVEGEDGWGGPVVCVTDEYKDLPGGYDFFCKLAEVHELPKLVSRKIVSKFVYPEEDKKDGQ